MLNADFARLFGIISTVLALGILFNPDDAKKMTADMIDTAAGYILSGVFPLIFGCLVVVEASHWVLGWPLVMTIIGWAMLLFGVFRLWFVKLWLRVVRRCLDEAPMLFSLFGLIMGLLLLYVGFVIN